MFQSSGKNPPRGGQLCNNASSHKLARQNTLKELNILRNALLLMSLLNYRTVVHHLVVIHGNSP
jgi:hypothetical protein